MQKLNENEGESEILTDLCKFKVAMKILKRSYTYSEKYIILSMLFYCFYC